MTDTPLSKEPTTLWVRDPANDAEHPESDLPIAAFRPATAEDITDRMAEDAWDAYCEARDNGEDEPIVVMRVAVAAALRGGQ